MPAAKMIRFQKVRKMADYKNNSTGERAKKVVIDLRRFHLRHARVRSELLDEHMLDSVSVGCGKDGLVVNNALTELCSGTSEWANRRAALGREIVAHVEHLDAARILLQEIGWLVSCNCRPSAVEFELHQRRIGVLQ